MKRYQLSTNYFIIPILAFFMSLVSLNVAAQTNLTVSGTVVDQSNSPLPGATVIIEGTTNGVSTNLDGVFQLTWEAIDEPAEDLASALIDEGLAGDTFWVLEPGQGASLEKR